MTFKTQSIDHTLSPEVEAWLKQEAEEQEQRYAIIAQQMDDLAPRRSTWYREFLDRIATRGFNADGDNKVVIATADLPVKPEGRKDQVVWKYGIDE